MDLIVIPFSYLFIYASEIKKKRRKLQEKLNSGETKSRLMS